MCYFKYSYKWIELHKHVCMPCETLLCMHLWRFFKVESIKNGRSKNAFLDDVWWAKSKIWVNQSKARGKIIKMPFDQSIKVIYCPINTFIYYHLRYAFLSLYLSPSTTCIYFLLYISDHWLERWSSFLGDSRRTNNFVRFVGQQPNPIQVIQTLPQQNLFRRFANNPFLD